MDYLYKVLNLPACMWYIIDLTIVTCIIIIIAVATYTILTFTNSYGEVLMNLGNNLRLIMQKVAFITCISNLSKG